jgi:Cu2+-exporting ATPase
MTASDGDSCLRGGEADSAIGTVATVVCAHCGLPSPPPPHPGEPAFCCSGCLGAYQLIRNWGLEDYYALRDRLSAGTAATDVAVATVETTWEDFDDPDLLGESIPRDVGAGLVASACSIRGLHCGACAWLIERSAPLVPGWHSARVRMNDHSVELVYDPRQTRLSEIAKWLSRLGYRIGPLVADARAKVDREENRRLLTRIAIAAFCATNAMWIAVALYAGHFSGIAVGHANLLRVFGSLLGVLAVFGPGGLFLRGAWASLRTRTPHMDLPLALALVVGAVAGLLGAITGKGEVFFDSITMLVFLLLVGRWVQFRQQRRAAQSVHLLMRISPRTAQRVEPDGSLRKIPADELVAGDRIRVGAGQSVAADGVVIAGRSSLDRSLLTGESLPVEIGPGDPIEAGTANLQSPIEVRVETSGSATRIGRLMRLVEDAAETKAPVVQLADRIGGWFVVTVICLATITAAIWWSRGSSQAITHAVALLIVACPCALALATPLALAVGIGRAARRRILIRGADVIERLATPGTVWFDKTGTLTDGQLRVVDWPDDARSLQLIAILERSSSHPVARAIVESAIARGLIERSAEQLPAIEPDPNSVDQRPGGGIVGVIQGTRVAVGNVGYLRSLGLVATPAVQREADRLAATGVSPVLYSIGAGPVGVCGVADGLRPDALAVVESLRRLGWRVGILSGDHQSCVARVADRLGIPADMALGELSPEAKLQKIRETSGSVVMVGDGVNDAAALAAAGVGVAIRGGAETSLDAAPVFLADGSLSRLPELMLATRRTVRLIRRTFAVSLGYNSIAILLAMAGRVSPLTAAMIMPASSLTVLAMILATATFSEEPE